MFEIYNIEQDEDYVKPKPRVLIYGDPGIGKTTFGMSAPSSLTICVETGANAVPGDVLPGKGRKIESWDEFIESLRFCYENMGTKYQWLVVDTINGAERLAAKKVCAEKFGGNWGSQSGGYDSFGKGDKITSELIETAIEKLEKIQKKCGCGVLLLAHTGTHTITNTLGQDYQKFVPSLNKHSWAKMLPWLEQVGHAAYDIRVHKNEGDKKAKAAVSDTCRWLWMGGTPTRDAKGRAGYEMPDRIPFFFECYSAALDGASMVEIDNIAQKADESLRNKRRA